MKEIKLEIADIFNKYDHLLGALPNQHHKVIQAIKNCRTKVLGGHKLKCNSCDYKRYEYNSCRNRHCPKCQFMSQAKWIEKRKEDLLPCPYFHVVFTLPAELRGLILRNKRVSYDILFKAASQSLKEAAASSNQLSLEIGCIGVLHTWAQNLIDHPHIHFIVPGGGLNKEKNKWIACDQNYLMPVKVLSKIFKAKILEYFEESFHDDKLKFMGEIDYLSHYPNFKELLINCASKSFNVDVRKPFAGPGQVIGYLGQYTHRIAISNYRLMKIEDDKVFFKVRDNDNPGESKVTSVHVKEFMRRFLLHVLPKAYVRIRHFGLLGNRYKKVKIGLIRKLKNIKEVVKAVVDETWQEAIKRLTGIDPDRCPQCSSSSLFKTSPFDSILNSS